MITFPSDFKVNKHKGSSKNKQNTGDSRRKLIISRTNLLEK